MKPVIIFASSRSQGNTRTIADAVQSEMNIPLIDLTEKDIAPYDYEYRNQDDDYKNIMEDILENYNTLILATPVYWYSMSAQMKAFIDRLSDLLRIHKDTGRKLRGMNLALITCAHDQVLYPEFTKPFERTANYLGMNFLGNVHGYVEEEGIVPNKVKEDILRFIDIFEV